MSKVSVDLVDLRDLLFGAFRYALGRRTYIVGTTADILIKYKNELPANYKTLMIKEISDAIDRGVAGMQMDIDEWNKVKRSLEEV